MKILKNLLYGSILTMVLSLVVAMGSCVGCAVNFVTAETSTHGQITHEGNAAMAPFAMTVLYSLLIFFVSLLVCFMLSSLLPRKKE
jgi:ABC-type antimicrobial peptide transport system permease subunit